MAELLSVEDALARVLADAAALPIERVPLAEACGRGLAAEVAARRTQPPAAVSAMDGYAVRAADLASLPARLSVVGEVAAGHPASRPVGAGETARIFTGGMLPAGADTVVVQEDVELAGDQVIISRPVGAGDNVRDEGIDFRTDEVLLRPGRRLTSRDVALAAAMNHAELAVHRRPRVALLATGDELVTPGSQTRAGQIIHSNGFALAALVRAHGGEAIDLGIAKDRLDDIVAAIARVDAFDADVLVTTGGASVGDHDLVRPALAARGTALSFWKVAVKPGKPLMYGRMGHRHVLGLPGNPVSSYVGAVLFLAPLLRRLQGCSEAGPAMLTAVLGCDVRANDRRANYLRATLAQRDGILVATPLANQDSSLLTPLARADCLLIRPPHAAPAPAGSACRIVKLEF